MRRPTYRAPIPSRCQRQGHKHRGRVSGTPQQVDGPIARMSARRIRHIVRSVALRPIIALTWKVGTGLRENVRRNIKGLLISEDAGAIVGHVPSYERRCP